MRYMCRALRMVTGRQKVLVKCHHAVVMRVLKLMVLVMAVRGPCCSRAPRLGQRHVCPGKPGCKGVGAMKLNRVLN